MDWLAIHMMAVEVFAPQSLNLLWKQRYSFCKWIVHPDLRILHLLCYIQPCSTHVMPGGTPWGVLGGRLSHRPLPARPQCHTLSFCLLLQWEVMCDGPREGGGAPQHRWQFAHTLCGKSPVAGKWRSVRPLGCWPSSWGACKDWWQKHPRSCASASGTWGLGFVLGQVLTHWRLLSQCCGGAAEARLKPSRWVGFFPLRSGSRVWC